jgi:hypothetical protein
MGITAEQSWAHEFYTDARKEYGEEFAVWKVEANARKVFFNAGMVRIDESKPNCFCINNENHETS